MPSMVKFNILAACLLALTQATSFPISTTRHLLSGTFAQGMGCKGSMQKLVNLNDVVKNSYPNATREADCLAACEARGNGCCRINYDWKPARCHWVKDGSHSSTPNTDHWAAQVTAAPTAFVQGMGCKGNRQQLVATREAECLAACEARGNGCCRINYDWTPARCHWVNGGSSSLTHNTDHWAAQVTAAPTASPSPVPTPAPIPPSVVLVGTPVSLQAKSTSMTKTATGHVGDTLSLSNVVGGHNIGFSPVFNESSVKIGFSTDFSSGGWYFPSGYFRVDFDFDDDVCFAGLTMTTNNTDLIQSDLTSGADWVRIGLAGSLLKNYDTILIDFSFMVCTAAPTQAPTTQAPTQAPTTQAPTSAPTQAPTPSPTPSPSASPTAAPTTAAPTTAAPTPSPTTASPSLAPTPAPTPFSDVLGTSVTIQAKSLFTTKTATGLVGDPLSVSNVGGHNTGFSPVFYNSSVGIGFSTEFGSKEYYFISGYFRVDFNDLCLAGATLNDENDSYLTQSDFTFGANWARIGLRNVIIKNTNKIAIDFSFTNC